MVLQQRVADLLAQGGLAHHHRHDVAGVVRVRHAGLVQASAQQGHQALLLARFPVTRLEVADAGERARGDRGRQRGGEDEAAGEAAHGVDQVGRAGDVAADHAVALGLRAFDDVDSVH